jgi:hypothetical protein
VTPWSISTAVPLSALPVGAWAFFALGALVLAAQSVMVWMALRHGAPRRVLALPTGGILCAVVALVAIGILAVSAVPA